jgi:hypothetical protein
MTREGYLKHKEIIEAWANGAEIEYQESSDDWYIVANPFWDTDSAFRVKPQSTYLELHEKCELKVGDKVRITRSWDIKETGGRLNAPINITNKIGVIKHKDHNSYEILLDEESVTWYYPYFVLEKYVEKWIPFTFEDALVGRKVKLKTSNYIALIIAQTDQDVNVNGDGWLIFQELLDNYIFLDGSPCGKLKQ